MNKPARDAAAAGAGFRATPRARVLDAAVTAWVVLWLALAVAVAQEVWGLSELSDSVVSAAAAVDATADVISSVEQLPFVDGLVGLRELERRVDVTAASARAAGRESTQHVHRLAILLGVAIALAPTVPLVALYVRVRRLL
jgi:hypothetical protein